MQVEQLQPKDVWAQLSSGAQLLSVSLSISGEVFDEGMVRAMVEGKVDNFDDAVKELSERDLLERPTRADLIRQEMRRIAPTRELNGLPANALILTEREVTYLNASGALKRYRKHPERYPELTEAYYRLAPTFREFVRKEFIEKK